MGRNTGPVERMSRRAGVDLELKGARRAAGKGALERRAYPPGQHGHVMRRRRSTYGDQLNAKQAIKRLYGIRETQFRRYVGEAQRATDSRTGDKLLQLLETRLDNVVYRLGFASTRAQARQFVGHGHVEVDGRHCDIPSRQVAPGAVVAIELGSPVRVLAGEATELIDRVPPWLEADPEALIGRVLHLPERVEIQAPVDDQMIIEYYSRV